MRHLYLIIDTAKLYVQFSAQNNLKSKYYYTMMLMLRALWLVVAHDLSEYRYIDVQHGARFWKCSWDYFGLKQVKSSKKVQQ